MNYRVRRLTQMDLEDLLSIYQLPEIYPHTFDQPYMNIEQINAKFANQDQSLVTLVAERYSMDVKKVIGQVSLKLNSDLAFNHIAKIDIAVDAALHTKGMGSMLLESAIEYASDWLPIRKLTTVVGSKNKAGLALFKKFNFVQEGELKQQLHQQGKYADVCILSLIFD